jgi:hypothetical protein
MSLWDDFKKVAKGIVSEAANVFEPALGGFDTLGQPGLMGDGPVNAKTGMPTIDKNATRLQVQDKATLKKIAALNATYAAAYSYGVSRPLTTLMLGADPGAEYAGKDEGNVLKDIKARFNASAYISPGQEIVAGFNNYIGDQDNGNSAREQVNNAMLKQQKLNNFKDNWLADVVSGTSDAAFNWYLDPLVLATKPSALAKAAERSQQVTRETEQIATKSGGAWEFVEQMTKETDVNVINKRLKGTNPILASALAESSDEQMTSLIWLASRGDQTALNTLRVKQASTAAQIQAISNPLYYFRFGGYPDGMKTAGIAEELADLKLLDRSLEKAMSTAGTNVFVSRARQDLSVSLGQTAGEEAQNIIKAEKSVQAQIGFGKDYSQYTKRVYQRGVGIRPVIVWTPNSKFIRAWQAGTAATMGSATGIFHLQGHNAADGSAELIANLRTGPLRKLFNGEEISIFNNRYLNAPNTTERSLILQEIEDEAVGRLFQKNLDDLDPERFQKLWADRDPSQTIKTVVDEIRVKKNETVDRVVKRDNGEFPDDEGGINVMKIFDTKTADTFIMLPWEAVDRAFRNLLQDKVISHKNLGEKIAGGYDAFMSLIWKPQVLFRLGYTIRNLTEGAARIISVTDALSAAQVRGSGGNFVKNRGVGFTAKALGRNIDDLTADHVNELDGIIASRMMLRGIDPEKFRRGEVTMARQKDLSSVLDEEDKLLASRQSVIENFLATGRYRLGADKESFLGVAYDGTFAGNGGRFLADLSSSRGTKAAEIGGTNAAIEGFTPVMPSGGKGYKWSNTSSTITRANESYAPALVDIINKQWRNSPLAKRILNGEDEGAVAKWLKSSDPEAVYVRNELGIYKDEVGQVVADAATVINRYMPDSNLRAVAATRDLRLPELQKSIDEFDKVDPNLYDTIVAKELLEADPTANVWRRGITRVFNYIGALPEDTVLRHPFVKTRYNQYMQQAIQDLADQGVTQIDNVTLEQYGRAARAYSLREVKRTLYTIERFSDVALFGRFIAPFYAAFENTGKTWARIMYNDPTVTVRGLMILNAPVQAGFVVDRDGQRVDYKRGQLPSKEWSLQMQIPESVSRNIPGVDIMPTINVNIKSLNVVFQGETPFTPGLGPFVQIPVSELTKNFQNGFTNWLADATLTNGVSKSPLSYDFILGTSTRRAISNIQGTDNPTVATDFAFIAQSIRTDYEKRGEKAPDNLLDIAYQRNRSLQFIKFFSALTSPVAVQFKIKKEYKQYVDAFRLFQKQGTVDGVSPSERFVKKYPDYFMWTLGTTENATGVQATRSARQNISRYGKILGPMLSVPGVDPGILGFILNNPEDTNYDQTVAAWQAGREVAAGTDVYYRNSKSVLESIDRPYISQGWREYIAEKNWIDSQLKENGFSSVNSAGAEKFKDYKKEVIDYLQDRYPQWYAEFNPPSKAKYEATAKALEIAFKDERFAKDKKNDTSVYVVSEYLITRRETIRDLEERKKIGLSGTITAKENVDILQNYINVINWMNESSPTAYEVYGRFFDNEFGNLDDYVTDNSMLGGS